VESDHFAGDLLGLPDRLFDPAYDWTGQGPKYFEGHPPVRDVFQHLASDPSADLHQLNMFFDPERNMLVMTAVVRAKSSRSPMSFPLSVGRLDCYCQCVMEKKVRITSVEEQDETRREDVLGMTPAQRVEALIRLRELLYPYAPLERVARVRKTD